MKKLERYVLKEIDGSKMYLDPNDKNDEDVSLSLLKLGFYEKTETDLFKKIINEGDVVVDIGANIGYYTLLAAKKVGERGKVFAFEAEPSNYALLAKNIEINKYGNVAAVQKAVFNKTGTAKLFLSPESTGEPSLCDYYNGKFVEVETVSLDEFFKSEGYKIDVIKMDIEGSEMEALQGMAKMLEERSNLKLITEFWPDGLKMRGFKPQEYLSKLAEHGFRLSIIDELGGYVKPIDIWEIMENYEREKDPEWYTNLFCEK